MNPANKKEGGLDKSRKRILIIIAVVAGVLIVALIVYLIVQKNAAGTTDLTAGIQIEEKTGSATLPTATATTGAGTGADGSPVAGTSAAPAPTATPGDLDYTRDPHPVKVKTLSQTVNIDPDNPCESIGVDNSWSNPFGKTVCGMATFVGNQVIEPLDLMTCRMAAASLNQNYSSNITANYKNGECLIIDR